VLEIRFGPEQGKIERRDLAALDFATLGPGATRVGVREGVAEPPAHRVRMTLNDQDPSVPGHSAAPATIGLPIGR